MYFIEATFTFRKIRLILFSKTFYTYYFNCGLFDMPKKCFSNARVGNVFVKNVLTLFPVFLKVKLPFNNLSLSLVCVYPSTQPQVKAILDKPVLCEAADNELVCPLCECNKTCSSIANYCMMYVELKLLQIKIKEQPVKN